MQPHPPPEVQALAKLKELEALLNATIELLWEVSKTRPDEAVLRNLRVEITRIEHSVRFLRDALGDSVADDLDSTLGDLSS
jgi:hypothetical protein